MQYIVKIVVMVVTGYFILMLVASPLVEKKPPPHTVETSYSATPVSTLVAPITGSYPSMTFYNHTGSWV
jgi:hypothetical protein